MRSELGKPRSIAARQSDSTLPDNTSYTFEIIAVRCGYEIGRIQVVASDADVALEEGRWLLAEEAAVNLFDLDISFLVDQIS